MNKNTTLASDVIADLAKEMNRHKEFTENVRIELMMLLDDVNKELEAIHKFVEVK